MQQRTAAWLILALVSGWGLGWFARDRWGPEPRMDRAETRVVPGVAHEVSEPDHPAVEIRPERSDALRRLLESRAFGRAVEHYEALQAQGDEVTVQHARDGLLEHARRLIAQADYPSAIDLLQRYLLTDYRDVDAHRLLAQARQGAGDLRAAIGQLYEAKGQAWRPETLEELERSIRAVVAGYADDLRQRGDNAGLLELY